LIDKFDLKKYSYVDSSDTSEQLNNKATLLREAICAEFKKKPFDCDLIECLSTCYQMQWKAFEDKVWQECGLPRLELIIKRMNDS